MSDRKKIPIEIPEGISWPEDVPIPEIEVVTTVMRKTVLDENGNLVEIETEVELPVIPDDI